MSHRAESWGIAGFIAGIVLVASNSETHGAFQGIVNLLSPIGAGFLVWWLMSMREESAKEKRVGELESRLRAENNSRTDSATSKVNSASQTRSDFDEFR